MRERIKAFTLVELLVVIGIIAVLISILLPSLARARRAANTVACSSNMRQIGLAMQMYCTDNSGYLPFGMVDVGPSPNANGNAITWDDLLNQYVGRSDSAVDLQNQWMPRPIPVFACPEDQVDRRTYPGATYQTRSYSMVQCAVGYGTPTLGMATRNFLYTTGWPINKNFRCFRPGDAPQSADTLLLAEKPMSSVIASAGFNRLGSPAGALVDKPLDQTGGGLIEPIHSGRWNYLFVDGHVATMPPSETLHAPATPNDTTLPNYMWTRKIDD